MNLLRFFTRSDLGGIALTAQRITQLERDEKRREGREVHYAWSRTLQPPKPMNRPVACPVKRTNKATY